MNLNGFNNIPNPIYLSKLIHKSTTKAYIVIDLCIKQKLNIPDNDKINMQGNNAHPIIDSANGRLILKLSNIV